MVKQITAAILLAALISGAFVYPVEAAAKKAPRRLDGVLVPPGQTNQWPVAVMIDNHAASRPPAGLDKASVVYEALAEGGIPRFMAVFAQPKISLIGPVRSARPYFVRYAAEYRAGLAHAGGSFDALNLLRSLRMPNFEGIKGKTAQYFYRRGGNCVYCLFTDSKQMTRALKAAKVYRKKPTYQPWKFKADPPLAERRTGKHGATVDFGAGAAYAIRYQYDRKKNVYQRFTGGRPHLDRLTRQQLTAKNVVLLLVPKERVLDRKGRISLNTIGKGKAVLLKDGYSRTIRWQKRTTYGRTMFTSLDGDEIEFNRGSVWITVVPRGHHYRLF
ncbi:MAG: DUF3048 domain-containing protein [Candidatus Kerfeldbacteria bacterium]|nr:DUF3048 domain-containing protein [Candidatus Kerfeldbacteria bacterium]